MKRFTLLFLVMTISIKAKPLEPYGNYLVVLVHGIHVNYETGNEQICIPCQSDIDCEEIKQKTIDTLRMETGLFQENFGVSVARSIRHEIDSVPEIVSNDTVWNYDTIHDTTRVVCYRKTTYEEEKKASHLFDPGADPFGMDFGDLKKYLEEELGIRGHVYAYNFHDPAETYHTFDTSESAMSLARQLGDRDSSFSYETGDYKLFPTYRPNLDRSDNWFYQNKYKEEDTLDIPVRSTITNMCWLEKAINDWGWYFVNKNSEDHFEVPSDIPDSLYPRKFILVGHSMGGLSTRGYIVSDFYQDDVDKLITIDSPHEGSDIINMIKGFEEMRGWKYYRDQFLAALLVQSVSKDNTDIWKRLAGQAFWDFFFGQTYKMFLADYDGNETGVLNLQNNSEVLKKFNSLTLKDDKHVPMYRLVTMTGSPTISFNTSELLYKWNKYSFITDKYIPSRLVPLLLPLVDFSENWSEFSSFDRYWAWGHSGALLQKPNLCVLGQKGDYFVPESSQKGLNVRLFQSADTKRWLMDTKKIHNEPEAYLNALNITWSVYDYLWLSTLALDLLLDEASSTMYKTVLLGTQIVVSAGLITGDFSAYGMKHSSIANYGLGPHGLCVQAVHEPVGLTKFLTFSGELTEVDFKTGDTRYVQSPYLNENISGNFIIDEALWERPAISIKEFVTSAGSSLRMGEDSSNVLRDENGQTVFWDSSLHHARSKLEAEQNRIQPEMLDSYSEMPLRFRNPNNGEVGYFSLPLLSNSPSDLPSTIQFVIDDLNPLRARYLSMSINNLSPKEFIKNSSDWTTPYEDTEIKAWPVTSQGELTVQIKNPTDFFSTSGLNTLSISIQNRIGFRTTRTFTFNTVEMAPQITDVFPYRNSVMSYKQVAPEDTGALVKFRIMVLENDPFTPTVERIRSASLTYDSAGTKAGIILNDPAQIGDQFTVERDDSASMRYYKVAWNIPSASKNLLQDNREYTVDIRIQHGEEPDDTSDALFAVWKFFLDETDPVVTCSNPQRFVSADTVLDQTRASFGISVEDAGSRNSWVVLEDSDGVYSSSGDLVKGLTGSNVIRLANGSTSLDWDGTLESGDPAPDGKYVIRCHATDDAKRYNGWYDPGVSSVYAGPKPTDNVLRDIGRKMWKGTLASDEIDSLRERSNYVSVVTDTVFLDNSAPVLSNVAHTSDYVTSHTSFSGGYSITFSSSDALSDSLFCIVHFKRLDENGEIVEQFPLLKAFSTSGQMQNLSINLADSSESADYPLPPDGRYDVELTVSDIAGNKVTSGVGSVVIDTRAPVPSATSAVSILGNTARCDFRINQQDDSQLRSDSVSVAVHVVNDSTDETFPVQITSWDKDAEGNVTCRAQFDIPPAMSMFHFEVSASDHYALPNTKNYTGASYRIEGRMPVISYPLENETVTSDIVIRGVAADPTNNGVPFSHYKLEADRWDENSTAWVDISGACQVPPALTRAGEQKNVAFLSREVDNSVLGYLSLDTIAAEAQGHQKIRLQLTCADGVSSVTVDREFQVETGENRKPLSIEFTDPGDYQGLFTEDTTPLLRFVTPGSSCAPATASYCIDDLLPVPYKIEQDGIFSSGDHINVKLQVISTSDNELIYETQHKALPAALFGSPNGSFDKDEGVWFRIDESTTDKLYLTAKNGVYVVTATCPSLRVNQELSSLDLALTTEGESQYDTSTNRVNYNSGDGSAVWQVDATGTVKNLTLDILNNHGEVLFLNVQKKYGDHDYKMYMDPAVRALNNGQGILFAGNKCESIGFIGGIDVGALKRVFSWDGLVHVGNSYTYVPSGGEYHVILEAFGRDNALFCSAQKTVMLEPAGLKLDGPYVSGDTIRALPGFSTSSLLKVGVNKPAYITVSVRDNTTGEDVAVLAQERPWSPGAKKFSVSWDGYIGDRLADIGKSYSFRIRATAQDSIGTVDLISQNELAVLVSDQIEPAGSSELSLDGTFYERFGGEDSVPFNTGTSQYKFIAQANGKFTPEIPVSVPVRFEGKQEAEAYPTENFAIGIRRSFDAIKLGYIIYARSLRLNVTGEDGLIKRWESFWFGHEKSGHHYRYDKMMGTVTIKKNDGLDNKIFREINAPNTNRTVKNKNDAIYLEEYKVAFFLLDKDGKSLGTWDGGEKICFRNSAGKDSVFVATNKNKPPSYEDYDQFRNKCEAAGAVDFFTVTANEMSAGGNYFSAGHHGDLDSIHIINYKMNSKWVSSQGRAYHQYDGSDNDEWSRYYDIWEKDSIQQFRDYVWQNQINFVEQVRNSNDFQRYTTPTFGLNKVEEAGGRFVVDSSESYNPMRGCMKLTHRECARQIKKIKWRGDAGPSTFKRYGYGYPVIELEVNLYDDVWDPDFGYNNIVNRFHIWSPENTLAYGESGYVQKDRLDNDCDGSGQTYDVGDGKKAEDGSDDGDTDGISETNGYLVYGQTQRINTYALGDQVDTDRDTIASVLKIKDYYSDYPSGIPVPFFDNASRASLKPEHEFMRIVNLMSPENYNHYDLHIKLNGAFYEYSLNGWYVNPGPESYKRYPQSQPGNYRSSMKFSSEGQSIIIPDRNARSIGDDRPLANAALELSLSLGEPKAETRLSWPLPAEFEQIAGNWVKEDPSLINSQNGPRNDPNELWVVGPAEAKPDQEKDLECIVKRNDADNSFSADILLDTVTLGQGNHLSDYNLVLPSETVFPSASFVGWNDTARYARYLKKWADSKGGTEELEFQVVRDGNVLNVIPVNPDIVTWNSVENDPTVKDVDDDNDGLVDEEGNLFNGASTDSDADNLYAEDGFGSYHSDFSDYDQSSFSLSLRNSHNFVSGDIQNSNDRKIPTPFLMNGDNPAANPNLSITEVNYRLLNRQGKQHPDLTIDADQKVVLKPFTKAPERLVPIKGTVHGPYEIFVSDKTEGYIKIVPPEEGKVNPFVNSRADDSTFTGTLGFWDISRDNGYKSVLLLEYGRNNESSMPKKYSFINQVFIGNPYTITSPLTLSDPYGKVKVTIPDGAIGEEMVFTVTPVTPVEANVSGMLATIGPIIEVTPSVSSFSNDRRPTIEWKLTKQELEEHGWATDELKIVRVGDEGVLTPVNNHQISYFKLVDGEEVSGTAEDFDLVAVTGNVSSFSRYAVVRNSDMPSEPVVLAALPGRSYENSILLEGTRDSTRQVEIFVTSEDTTRSYSVSTGNRNWSITIALDTGSNSIEARYSEGNTNSARATVSYYPRNENPLSVESVDPVISPDWDEAGDDIVLSVTPTSEQLPLNGKLEIEVRDTTGKSVYQGSLPLYENTDTLNLEVNNAQLEHGTVLNIHTTWVEQNDFIHLPYSTTVKVDLSRPEVVFDNECGQIVNTVFHIKASVHDESIINKAQVDLIGENDSILNSFVFSGNDTEMVILGIHDIWDLNSENLIGGKSLLVQITAYDRAGNRTLTNKYFDITENYSDWLFSKDMILDLSELHANGEFPGTFIPVPVQIDSTELNFRQCGHFGEDVRFLDTSGNLLAYEMEFWSKAKERAVFWVRAPFSEDSIVAFRMLWGNSCAGSRQNHRATWGPEFKAVYHSQIAGAIVPAWFERGGLVLSQENISIGDNTRLYGDVSSSSSILFGNDIYFEGNSFSEDSIAVGHRSVIEGNLSARNNISFSSSAAISGTVADSTFVSVPSYGPVVSVPLGTETVTVPPGDTLSISAGTYGTFHAYANSDVHFTGGVYTFNKFILEPDVKLYFDCAPNDSCNINVRESIRIGDRCTTFVADNLPVTNVRFYSNQTEDFTIGTDGRIGCILISPSSKLVMNSRTSFTGSIVAHQVKIEPEAALFSVEQEIKPSTITLFDASKNGNDATVIGGDLAPGYFADGIALNGSTDFVKLESESFKPFTSHQFTISAWIKVPVHHEGPLFTDAASGWSFDLKQNGSVWFTSTTESAKLADSLCLKQWVHVTAVRDGSGIRFYLNGTKTGETTLNQAIPLRSEHFVIGRTACERGHLLGQIDELRVSSSAFSDAQVRFFYETERKTNRAADTSTTGSSEVPTDSGSDILDFEDAALWKSNTSATLMTDTLNKLSGNASLQISAGGYQEIISEPFGIPLNDLSDNRIRLFITTESAGTNTHRIGALQMYLSCPSLGIYDLYLGQKDIPLTATEGAFEELSYTVPADYLNELSNGFSDARIRIVFNTDNNFGPFNLDNINFMQD